MRQIALFLLSSILTPATLAAGQSSCLLAAQVKVMTPLPADNSITGWTDISDSSSPCAVRPVDIPLRPVASRETLVPLAVTTRSSTVVVVEILLARLGWIDIGHNEVAAVPAGLQMRYKRAMRSNLADSFTSSKMFSLADRENAVLRF